MYYSWFNITAAYNNNNFSYNWVTVSNTFTTTATGIQTGTTITVTAPSPASNVIAVGQVVSGTGIPANTIITTVNSQTSFVVNKSVSLGSGSTTITFNTQNTSTYNVTIPDGLYEVADLNLYLQYVFLQNGHYLVNSAGQNVFYGEFLINVTRYAVQMNTYSFPTSLPTGYSNPAGVAFPPQTFNPSIVLPSSLGALLGYSSGLTTYLNQGNPTGQPTTNTYVQKNQTTGTLSYLSTSSPNIQPNSSILISCTAVDNPYAQPNSIIYSLTPSVNAGEIITEKPPQFMFNKLFDGTYNQLRVTILGSNLQPININDPSITIILAIADDDEVKRTVSFDK
jgi:hypothetical protein